MKSGWFVIARGIAGFSVAFLVPLSALFHRAAQTNSWPPDVAVIAAVMAGLVSGFNALIMFLDGSFNRWRENGQEPKQPTT